MRFLALGDSYTIGEGVDPSERWPVQLVRALRDAGRDVEDPVLVARTGWTTDELRAGLARRRPAPPYDLVSLSIGVNNQYRGGDEATYRNEFRALLEMAIGYAGGRAARVFIVSIPDWGVAPFAEGRDRRAVACAIDRFNRINRREAQRRGVRYVDVTPASRAVGADPASYAADGLHPSGRMYAGWVRLALPVALDVLKKEEEGVL